MSEQFPIVRFARGVKATFQHVFTPLQQIAATAALANVTTLQEKLGAARVSWVIPWLDSQAAESGQPILFLPWTAPPFQQLFNRDTLQDPSYPVWISELCLAFDQRATPYGITGTSSVEGEICAADMSRYDMVLRLLERAPSAVSSDTTTVRELAMFEISGLAKFGSPFVSQNPLLISDLSLQIKPFCVYVWELSCKGLFSSQVNTDQLALVSLSLDAVLLSTLTTRDVNGAGVVTIQNIPTKHNGGQVGTTIPVVTPAADAIITGTDIQNSYNAFDRVLQARAASGYGLGYGAMANAMQAADAPPAGLLAFDSHYQMIAIPLWAGQKLCSTRANDVVAAGLPFLLAPWTMPAIDARTLPLPDNFVIHHAFAVWNNWSPPSTQVAHVGFGIRDTSINYVQSIGIAISSGMESDDYKYQQVAALTFDALTTGGSNLIDLYEPLVAGVPVPCYAMFQIPLVNPVAPWTGHTWAASGRPFFIGHANSGTADRSLTTTLAAGVWNGAFGTPATHGRENTLEVRWTKQQAAAGLNAGGNVVRCGQGGEWVILCGRQTVGA